MKRFQLSRRSFLRGALGGVAISLVLPPLEAMLDHNGAYADGGGEEPFFGLFYWANGLPWNAKHGAMQASAGKDDLWTPMKTGPDYAPSPLLLPLARHKVCVATGLEPKTEIPPVPPGQGDGHMRGFMVAMTGDRVRSEGFDHPSHTLTALRPTLDQLVAKHPAFYKTAPRFRSLQVGVSRARFHEYGHWNAISYNGPDSLNPPILSATELFDKLFAVPLETAEQGRRAKVLDAVLDDAKRLRRGLSARDAARLDSHLDQIAEIQRRLSQSSVSCKVPGRPSDDADLHKKTTAMADLLAIAVNCGLTKAFSFMLTSPATTHVFSNLGVGDDMHTTCHAGRWDDIRKIAQYQMEAFALFLDSFAKIKLPSGQTLLDRACIYGTSEYGEGWQHGEKEHPLILAGGSCGRLLRGVHTREPGGNLCKAQLTALKALGLPFDKFGFSGAETNSTVAGMLAQGVT
ncbi:MAG TPA: DUF1552 domain-containing protein [Pseudomonadota bacterium]|nr:DUF1552 domain-containing protein [Pseudomonadota bacterium]HNN52978.1 DUF1552 domain-containing protein [Pseudomonadota bacterium]HNO68929.1 DUF1552 domain-containing protein [Pseudomonadota bacterium]